MVEALAGDVPQRKRLTTLQRFKDAGTADFLTGLMERHEKAAWMLRAQLETEEEEELHVERAHEAKVTFIDDNNNYYYEDISIANAASYGTVYFPVNNFNNLSLLFFAFNKLVL
mgnify:CR=1 FL=1